MMVSFKGAPVVKDIILTGVRWYVVSPLSDRQVGQGVAKGDFWAK
jgi:hypothetical protein